MLRRQDPCCRVGDKVGPFDHHSVDQAVVVFNMPFQSASMSGIRKAWKLPSRPPIVQELWNE